LPVVAVVVVFKVRGVVLDQVAEVLEDIKPQLSFFHLAVIMQLLSVAAEMVETKALGDKVQIQL
jgi:hypothetical protein